MSNDIATVNTDAIRAVATGFLARAEQVREAIASVMWEHPYAAAAAMIAGQFAIEERMTDEDKAYILKCVSKGKLKVEGGNKPADVKIFEVVAEAAAKQLRFCADDYSVWTNGTLYIKEGGYRHLLTQRPGVSHVDINPGVPTWRQLQGGKAMWIVEGEASAVVNGELVTIKATVGVNSNQTDGIAKIEAHAARSLAKRLWKKVSSIDMECDDETEQVEAEIQHVEMKNAGTMRVTQKPTGEGLPPSGAASDDDQEQKDAAIRRRVSREGKHGRVAKILDSAPEQMAEFQAIWDEILAAKNHVNLDAIADALKQPDIPYSTLGKDVKDIVKWLWADKKKELAEGIEG